VSLQPLPSSEVQASGEAPAAADLSLEYWSLQACTDVVKEATGLQMRLPASPAAGMMPIGSGMIQPGSAAAAVVS
jgi:hypothetical protein